MDKEKFVMNGFFKCRNETRFIILEKVCDKIYHCLYGNDELLCKWPTIVNNRECNEISLSYLMCYFEKEKKENDKKIDIFNVEYSRILILKGKYRKNILKTSYYLKMLKIYDFEKYFDETLNYFPNLVHLELNENSINENSSIFRQPLKKLRIFICNKNKIKNLNFFQNLKSNELEILKIYHSNIIHLNKTFFKYTKNLMVFHLLYSKIQSFDKHFFHHTVNLQELSFFSTEFQSLTFAYSIRKLKKLRILNSSNFQFCCLSSKYLMEISECFPKKKKYEMCNSILDTHLKKTILWLFVIFGIFENLYAIYYFSNSVVSSKYFKLAFSFSQFLLFLYFLIFVNFTTFFNNYHLNIILKDPIFLPYCSLMRILYDFSSINSIIFYFLIALERYLVISNPIKTPFIKQYPIKISLINLFISLIFVAFNFFLSSV